MNSGERGGAPASVVVVGFFLFFVVHALISAALPENDPRDRPALPSFGGGGINSNSVLVGLLDSHYTELAKMVEKALLLQTLEDAVGRHNLIIFAPRNHALDPEFKRFLLEPRNLRSLQTLILFHVLPTRVGSLSWPKSSPILIPTLSREPLHLSLSPGSAMLVGGAAVLRPDAIVRPDGVIHGIERLLVPRSVQEGFNRRRSLAAISVVLPTGAPEVDPRTHRLKKPPPPAPRPPRIPPDPPRLRRPRPRPRPRPGPRIWQALVRWREPGQGLHPNPPPLRRIQRIGQHFGEPHLPRHRDGALGLRGLRPHRARPQRRGHGAAQHGSAQRARGTGADRLLPLDPGVPDRGEHVQRRAEVREGPVRHPAAAAQGRRQGGRRLRQVRPGRGIGVSLRSRYLHRRPNLRPGDRRCALPAGRGGARSRCRCPSDEEATRGQGQAEEREVDGGNMPDVRRHRPAFSSHWLPVGKHCGNT